MTPEQYLKYKRGIKDEVYGPDRRQNGIVGYDNIDQSDNEMGTLDPRTATYDQLHRENVLGDDTTKLEADLKGMEVLP